MKVIKRNAVKLSRLMVLIGYSNDIFYCQTTDGIFEFSKAEMKDEFGYSNVKICSMIEMIKNL